VRCGPADDCEPLIVWVNARRCQANLDAGRIVLNDGRIGCGEVVKNFGESTIVVQCPLPAPAA
jgi:hypothetical protein